MKKKNIIFVWDQNPYNVRDEEGWDNPNGSYWGIGDIIRGIIYTYKLCQENDYNFYIDFQKHLISKFLKINKHPFYEYVKNNNKIPFIWKETPESYIKKNNCDTILLMHNWKCKNYNPPSKLLQYLDDLFTPNDIFLEYINKLKNEYNIPDKYNIFHFRLGGCEKIKKWSSINDNIITNAINIFSKYKENNDVIISDTKIIKQKLKEKYNKSIIIDLDNICHFGNCTDDISTQNTLLEFLLLVNANSIKTFSKFRWISGFAQKAAIIKNVPLKHFKV